MTQKINAPFNAEAELFLIRDHRKILRSKIYRKSRLSRFRVELVELRKTGASFNELVLWLKKNKRVKVWHTTISRYLSTLPELMNLKIGE